MKKQYFVDDTILATLLKTEQEAFWKTAYAHYREPFVHYFKKHHRLALSEGQNLFQEVFALLVQGLRVGKIEMPLCNTLFAYLASLGAERLAQTGHRIETEAVPMMPYLAGEVLILLLQRKCVVAFETIIRQYQSPICMSLKSKYFHSREKPEEVFGESMMAMKENVEVGKLDLPLQARLYTYTYRIVENKFRAFIKMMDKGAPLQSLDELERIFARLVEGEEEKHFLDYISDLYPTLSIWLEAGENAFEGLTSMLDDSDVDILSLRFEEGLTSKEIGEILGMLDGTVRRRFGIIFGNWRKIFFFDIIKNAPHPVREYLKCFLIERWLVDRIAKHFKRPEAEVKQLIEAYLRDWRRRNGG